MSNKLLLLITELQKSPTANHLHCFFFFGCQIKHKFFIKNQYLNLFINTFSCHSECTTKSTLILTPNVISQRLLIRISTDENLRYIVIFSCNEHKTFRDVNSQGLLIRIATDENLRYIVIFSFNEHKTFRDVNSQGLLIRIATDENLRYIVILRCNEHKTFRDVNNNYF